MVRPGKLFLKLQTAVSVASKNDCVVVFSVQVAQVSSRLIVSDIVLPPLRPCAGLENDCGIIFTCAKQCSSLRSGVDLSLPYRHIGCRCIPFTSKQMQPEPFHSWYCSSDNQAHSHGGTTSTLLEFTRNMSRYVVEVRGLICHRIGDVLNARTLQCASSRNASQWHKQATPVK